MPTPRRKGAVASLTALFLLFAIGTAVSAAAPREPAAHQSAPSIPDQSFKGLDGRMHSLTQWKGKVLLLNFWASWCAPCQMEIRDFIRYQASYGDQGLQIVGLGMDEARKLGNVKRTLGINYPILVADQASDRRLLAEWGNRSGVIPYTLIFDKSGTFVRAHQGLINDMMFERYVTPLLQE